ncbi:hypothetical protein [uncultured Bacteroides sp.]|uniref:hypothetical protein n=1 Tax=uncultured Bacteroides sp. TaxID=162156 RepID=UPI002AAB40F4|nr:hypothetical protein [uncultured Bacteroides sp.]
MRKYILAGLRTFIVLLCFSFYANSLAQTKISANAAMHTNRQSISINEGWRFL